MKKLSLAFLALVTAAACGKSASGAPSSRITLELPKVLGLKIEAPAGTSVGDAIAGGHMLTGPDFVVIVDVAKDSRPATVAAAKDEAGMYTPKNLKEEKLADGWLLQFENAGGMGTNYFVQARREIGGKPVWCETTASKPEQQANAVAACKSIKP